MNQDFIYYMEIAIQSIHINSNLSFRKKAIQSIKSFHNYANIATSITTATVFINSGHIKPQLAYLISFYIELSSYFFMNR